MTAIQYNYCAIACSGNYPLRYFNIINLRINNLANEIRKKKQYKTLLCLLTELYLPKKILVANLNDKEMI
jgi:hypothetical protein